MRCRRFFFAEAAAIAALSALAASCNVWGPRDNVVDSDGTKYQGYPTVSSSAEIQPVSPANGGTLSTSSFTISAAVAGATAYELRVASSAAGLDSSPLFVKADFPDRSMTLLSDSIVTWNTYYWKARARTSSGWDSRWSPVYCFKTDFPYVWIDRSTTATATKGKYWISIASSSDGRYFAAVENAGYIWTSSDYGATWASHTGPGTKYWASIASSSDGKNLVAAESDHFSSGYIWTSTDYGASWTSHTGMGIKDWSSVASSSDGKYLVAVENLTYSTGYIWTSSDCGSSWTSRTGPKAQHWVSVASSSDGKYLVAVAYGSYIWTSSDYGVTWNSHTGPGYQYWSSVASSFDGMRLVAAFGTHPDGIWISSDFGANWSKRVAIENLEELSCVTASSDGRILAVAGEVYVDNWCYKVALSKDYGATWKAEDLGFTNDVWVAFNADGTRLGAAIRGGDLYTGSCETLVK